MLLLCLDRDTGKTLWSQIVLQRMLEGKRDYNSHASGTPATDGEHVYVTFLEPDGTKVPTEGVVKFKTPGHIVVAAYTMDGQQAWQVRPAEFLCVNGSSASPVLFEDKVIINADHDGKGYIVALDRSSGETVWKIDRENNVRLATDKETFSVARRCLHMRLPDSVSKPLATPSSFTTTRLRSTRIGVETFVQPVSACHATCDLVTSPRPSERMQRSFCRDVRISGGRILLRTSRHLYCIAESDKQRSRRRQRAFQR